MIFLALNIIFGSAFVLCIKWVQNRQREDVISVGCINYITGFFGILPWFLLQNSSEWNGGAVMTGSGMGACYFVAYFFVIYAIRYVGVSASSVVGVLSILMPIVFGILFWSEEPTLMQAIGIAMALLALLLIGGTKTEEGKSDKRKWFTPFLLIGFFLLAGLSRLSQAAFNHVSDESFKPTFLIAAFLVAAVPSVSLLIYRKKKIMIREIMMGILLGASNLLQSFFLLKSLEYFPGFVVFPVVSAGGLVFITLIATQVFKEKLNRKSYLGIGIAAIALVLLHWMPGN